MEDQLLHRENVGPLWKIQQLLPLITTTGTIPIEFVSISSIPQVSSTGMEERMPIVVPICLPEEDPHIPCPVCNVTDCVIHNPRHRYCMDCGQRLLGLHECPNEIEHPELPIVQYPIPTGVAQSARIQKGSFPWRPTTST